MSAIVEEGDNVFEPVKVLIAMHEGMDTLDAMGPLEVFSWAQHDKSDECTSPPLNASTSPSMASQTVSSYSSRAQC